MIYFAQHAETGLIKIGYSGNVSSRVVDLSSKFGALKLLGFIEGNRRDEEDLQWHFREFNVRRVLPGREWFSAAPALLDYIAANCITSDAKEMPPETTLVSTFPVVLARKEERDGRRYNQRQISLATGVSQAVMSRVFRGDIEGLNLATVRKLCVWLDCEYGDFMYIDQGERETA